MALFDKKRIELVHNLPKFWLEKNIKAMPVPNIHALDMLLFHTKKEIKFTKVFPMLSFGNHDLKWPKLNLISMPVTNMHALDMLLFHK